MELFNIGDIELITRMGVAVLLALFIGAERSRVGKRAGMRTYALVALGSAMFAIIGNIATLEYLTLGVELDTLRMSAGIITGIGFLGAGVIFVQRSVLTGLTTAAGLWVAAAIGIACGYGLYTIAIFATLLVLFIFQALWYIEDRFVKSHDEPTQTSTGGA